MCQKFDVDCLVLLLQNDIILDKLCEYLGDKKCVSQVIIFKDIDFYNIYNWMWWEFYCCFNIV